MTILYWLQRYGIHLVDNRHYYIVMNNTRDKGDESELTDDSFNNFLFFRRNRSNTFVCSRFLQIPRRISCCDVHETWNGWKHVLCSKVRVTIYQTINLNVYGIRYTSRRSRTPLFERSNSFTYTRSGQKKKKNTSPFSIEVKFRNSRLLGSRVMTAIHARHVRTIAKPGETSRRW